MTIFQAFLDTIQHVQLWPHLANHCTILAIVSHAHGAINQDIMPPLILSTFQPHNFFKVYFTEPRSPLTNTKETTFSVQVLLSSIQGRLSIVSMTHLYFMQCPPVTVFKHFQTAAACFTIKKATSLCSLISTHTTTPIVWSTLSLWTCSRLFTTLSSTPQTPIHSLFTLTMIFTLLSKVLVVVYTFIT